MTMFGKPPMSLNLCPVKQNACETPAGISAQGERRTKQPREGPWPSELTHKRTINSANADKGRDATAVKLSYYCYT